MSDVKKLNELGSGRVVTNLGLDAAGKLIKEPVSNENYTEVQYGGAGRRWARVLSLSQAYASGILFLGTGIWSGAPRVLTIAVNYAHTADNTANYHIRVLNGDSAQLYAARMVKEGGSTYLEFETYGSKAFAKAIGIDLDIVPRLPVSSPASDAEITALDIIREPSTT